MLSEGKCHLHKISDTLGSDVVKSGVFYLDNSKSKSDPAVEEVIPYTFALEQNYPNPFNPSTTIRFSIPKEQHVSLKIYNIMGNEIAELCGRDYDKGFHNINFNADKFVSGMYFYKIQTPGFSKMKKMMLIK
jgi:hypothetical protein